MKSTSLKLPYKSSVECMHALHSIEAIDYFFAKQVFDALLLRCFDAQKDIPTQGQTSLLFHLFLAISYFQRDGHICINTDALCDKLLWHDEDQISPSDFVVDINIGYRFPSKKRLKELMSTIQGTFKNEAYIVINDDCIYTKRYWYYETQLCEFVQKKCSTQHSETINFSKSPQTSSLLGQLFPHSIVENNHLDLQQLATLRACLSRFSIITGGAGTGKTYTIARLVMLKSVIEKLKTSQIELLAPTGKAANRVYESFQKELVHLEKQKELEELSQKLMQIEAKTIHRLLKIDPITGQPRHDQHNRIEAKLVIVDESSMLDVSMLVKLINALNDDVTLILVGDANQLPSIESGSLLADLVNHPLANMNVNKWQHLSEFSPQLTTIDANNLKEIVGADNDNLGFVNRLTQSRRNNPDINQLANSILAMDIPAFTESLNLPSIKYINVHKDRFEQSLKQYIVDVVDTYFANIFAAKSVQEAFGFFKAFALLSPFRRGYAGTDNLNRMIESTLFSKAYVSGSQGLYAGKPIMITKNDYKLGLFNGDVGIIWQNENGGLSAYFLRENNTLKSVSIHSILYFETTYAMTIHKTQGSEFTQVAVILPDYNQTFLSQQLLYTAVTRARNKVDILASKEVLLGALQHKTQRISGIEKRLT